MYTTQTPLWVHIPNSINLYTENVDGAVALSVEQGGRQSGATVRYTKNKRGVITLAINAGAVITNYYNGATKTSVAYTQGINTAYDALYDWILGYISDNNGKALKTQADADNAGLYDAFGGWSYEGYVHEIRVYPTVHDDATVATVAGLLKQKWSIT